MLVLLLQYRVLNAGVLYFCLKSTLPFTIGLLTNAINLKGSKFENWFSFPFDEPKPDTDGQLHQTGKSISCDTGITHHDRTEAGKGSLPVSMCSFVWSLCSTQQLVLKPYAGKSQLSSL
jgi:hypothetical protein